IIVTMIAAVAPVLMTAPARAATFSIGDTVLVNTDYLNLRSDAGTDGTIRDVLIYGQSLEVLDGPRSDDGLIWYRVGVDATGIAGWVAGDYIAYSLVGGPSSDFEGAPGVRVVDGPLNVRGSAGLDGSIVGTLSTGFEVPTYASSGQVVSADGYDWIRILFGNGIEGWAATDFLTPLNYSPNLGSDDGWSSAEGVEVVNGPVNLRLSPSLDGAIFDTADTGDIINLWVGTDLVSADGYTWIKLKSFSSAEPLWAAIDFLRPVADMPCSDGACYPEELNDFFGAETAVVTDGPVNMRSAPTTSAAILLTLEEGDYLFGVQLVYSQGGDPVEADGYFWVYATAGGFEGYVAIDFLTVVA
ncbi:MAG: SH3 domain-containing protein, partial [Chloroflexota bacterium]|nr:SH3 domain-containing protein [Chloroflexota bacterium]